MAIRTPHLVILNTIYGLSLIKLRQERPPIILGPLDVDIGLKKEKVSVFEHNGMHCSVTVRVTFEHKEVQKVYELTFDDHRFNRKRVFLCEEETAPLFKQRFKDCVCIMPGHSFEGRYLGFVFYENDFSLLTEQERDELRAALGTY